MINFNNKKSSKTKRVFAAIIIVILVLAMVLPMAVSAFIQNVLKCMDCAGA